METFIWILVILFSIVIHEVSHGLAACALGDPTAKQAGRLTLNPLKHIDPFWTVILPAALYLTTHGRLALGMAKPVPVDFSRLRSPRAGSVLVALAGPLANVLFAALLGRVWFYSGMTSALYAAYLNLGLAVFNLIPVPPLDGSRLIMAFLPLRFYPVYQNLEKFGFLIILLLYWSGLFFYWLVPGIRFFCALLNLPPLDLELLK